MLRLDIRHSFKDVHDASREKTSTIQLVLVICIKQYLKHKCLPCIWLHVTSHEYVCYINKDNLITHIFVKLSKNEASLKGQNMYKYYLSIAIVEIHEIHCPWRSSKFTKNEYCKLTKEQLINLSCLKTENMTHVIRNGLSAYSHPNL